jgi:hypothetical protein
MIHTEQLMKMLLNYVATYLNNGIVYRASDMVLCMHADADTSTKLDLEAEKRHISSSWKMIHHHPSTAQS